MVSGGVREVKNNVLTPGSDIFIIAWVFNKIQAENVYLCTRIVQKLILPY